MVCSSNMKTTNRSKSTKNRISTANIKVHAAHAEPEAQSDFINHEVKAKKFSWAAWILGIIVVVLLFGQGWPIVAIVNYKPIFRWQLNATLNSRYGKQTLEQMISEDLISTEAKKQKISVSKAEIDAKTTEIIKGLGENVTLDDLLSYQGMSKTDFENQLKLQLMVTKLLGSNVKVSETEIADYISKNQSLLTATTEAELNAEAKAAIIDQKVTEQLQTWFQELKAKAKIFRLI